MPPNLRYSAAKTSIVNKRPYTSNSKQAWKLHRGNILNPGKASKPIKANLFASSPKTNKKEESKSLEIADFDVHLDYQILGDDDLATAVDKILENQWAESNTLKNRYFTREEIANATNDEDLLFQIKGIALKTKADIVKYRRSHLPHGMVTINQLYSIYEHQGQTFVDKNLELNIRKGKLKKFIITNAAPVIQRSQHVFQHGKVTYGYENVELVVKTENYLDRIKYQIKTYNDALKNETISHLERELALSYRESLEKFLSFVVANPTSLFVTVNDILQQKHLSDLVTLGYMTLTSNHMNEIESQYSISFPNCGTFLKLINSGRVWLVKTLNKTKHKELLEDELFNRWEVQPSSFTAAPRYTNFRPPFYGYDLIWILADALGAGIIEVFNTPVGRGWHLTGKV